uniref:Uncharacterized conserved protein, contains ParB-like and HNH nuclease domains n=1 Tax=Candidatus Kentrum sp. FW TaxID=2126338 RepID=A0A450T155_9GAMM|nr:MAG: Uncharacterized conserved protein, contains ParB-like and HNH nuclease domains [Candidatus Kentron sp. FW]
MNFNTANQTFRQLMGNGLLYRVPPFQRDYSWTIEEWEDLWQDIFYEDSTEERSPHYLGYLVLQSVDNKHFDIIDGQQRLTTISIGILAALGLIKEMVEKGEDEERNRKRLDSLQNSYIGYVDPVSLVSRPKLELNRHNNHFYQKHLVTLDHIPQRGLKPSEHQLRKAFAWFRERLINKKLKAAAQPEKGGEALAAFIDTLVDKLFFTVITVTDELNAFTVFETLNARGVRLSATDLLKNYLFSIISDNAPHEMKDLEERWERLVGQLGSESFPDFLRVYWNSLHSLVRKRDLFKTIRRRVTDREAAFALLRDLEEYAEIYAGLRDPFDKLWDRKEQKSLNELSLFGVRQPLALLLACYKHCERADFTRILRAVAVISFRYNVVCNLPPQDQERLYNEVARKVSDGSHKTRGDIIAALRKIYPDDNKFKTDFGEKELRTTSSRNRRVARYVLFALEKQLSGQDFEFESATYDIEHILPENPSESWASAIAESKQERMIYRLGNMTPLETGRNRELGNADYETKRGMYRDSDFQITQAIAKHYDQWNENKHYDQWNEKNIMPLRGNWWHHQRQG